MILQGMEKSAFLLGSYFIRELTLQVGVCTLGLEVNFFLFFFFFFDLNILLPDLLEALCQLKLTQIKSDFITA